MGNLDSWICDGIPKNGLEYPQAKGQHYLCENFSPVCPICGLPQEALLSVPSNDTTRVSRPNDDATKVSPAPSNYHKTNIPPPPFLDDESQKTSISGGEVEEKPPQKKLNNLLNVGIGIGIGVIISGALGLMGYQSLNKNSLSDNGNNITVVTNPNEAEIISLESKLPEFMSQGEKILFQSGDKKQQATEAFTQKNWAEAITLFEQYITNNNTDPEAKIYLQNAKANQNGNPMTIAVAVEISTDNNSASEILRGVASYQEDFNQPRVAPEDRLLEVVIIDSSDYNQAENLAQEMIRATKVLGVMGYGIDIGSQRALDKYNDSDLVALSPLTSSVTEKDNISILKRISPQEKSNELLGDYLASVSDTLLTFANDFNSPPRVMLFYHSDNAYGMELREKMLDALPNFKGELVKEIDLKTNRNPQEALNDSGDTNTIFLALGQNELTSAIEILRANNAFLMALGSDELFHPNTLTQGKEAVDQLVLAVPWTFNPDEEFAQEAEKNWRGRVSWRTATAYDTTKALVYAIASDPERPSILKVFQDGIRLPDTTTKFQVFSEVPLVQVVPGKSGLEGAGFQFESLD